MQRLRLYAVDEQGSSYALKEAVLRGEGSRPATLAWRRRPLHLCLVGLGPVFDQQDGPNRNGIYDLNLLFTTIRWHSASI